MKSKKNKTEILQLSHIILDETEKFGRPLYLQFTNLSLPIADN